MKLPFEMVLKEVERLYAKDIDYSNDKAIQSHCEFIADYIKACGWTEEEFEELSMNSNVMINPTKGESN